MKILRTALILAVAMVVVKILQDTSWQSRESFDRHLIQRTDTIPQQKNTLPFQARQIDHNRTYDTEKPVVTTKDTHTASVGFILLDSQALQALFTRNKPSLTWDITLQRHGTRIDVTLYHLRNQALFPLAAQSVALYMCDQRKRPSQESIKLHVSNATDDERRDYLLDAMFCKDTDRSLPLLSHATDTQSVQLKLLNKPPRYKRLQPVTTLPLYDTNQTGPTTVGLIKQSAVNDTYFVYLDDEGRLAYFNRKTRQIRQIPDFQRDFIPTAVALGGDRLYTVENYLYAYDLQSHRVHQASEALGWGDRIVVKGDRIYVLKKENGWYLFVYDKTLHLRYALHTSSDFVDLKIRNADMVAYDFKRWYRFDIRTGKVLAQVDNTNLMIAASSTQIIDNHATVYDKDLKPAGTLKPSVPIVDAVFTDHALYVQNLDTLAVYDPQSYRRIAVIPNKSEYLAASHNGKTYVTILQKGVRYGIDFYDKKLQPHDRLNMTRRPDHAIAASSSYAAFSVGNRLVVIDTDHLKVLNVRTIPEESRLFDVNGSSIYFKDASGRFLRYDTKSDYVPSVLSALAKDNRMDLSGLVVSDHLLATYAMVTSEVSIYDLSKQTLQQSYQGVDKVMKLSDHTIAFAKGRYLYDSQETVLASSYPYDRNSRGDAVGVTTDREFWIQPVGSHHRYGYWVGFMLDLK